jgi:hypothetical protein
VAAQDDVMTRESSEKIFVVVSDDPMFRGVDPGAGHPPGRPRSVREVYCISQVAQSPSHDPARIDVSISGLISGSVLFLFEKRALPGVLIAAASSLRSCTSADP